MPKQPGEVVDVRPFGPAVASAKTEPLVKTGRLQIVRLVVHAGKDIPTHTAKGELIVQCLEGRVAFTAMGRTHDLTAGQLLVLPAGEPHSLKGIEDSSLLVTVAG